MRTLNWTSSALRLYNACVASTPNRDVFVFAYRGDPLDFVALLPWLCMTVFAIAGLVAALYFLRFLRNWEIEKPEDENSLLTKFREMHRSRELSAEEYRDVRIRLAEQMRDRVEESSEDQR